MTLHEQSKNFLDAAAAAPPPAWKDLPVDEARAIFSDWKHQCGDGPKLADVKDAELAGNIPVRIYRPHADEARPVVMYFHGGGWVLGDLDSHDSVCRFLASDSGCTVIAVHYRRAPEHPFPAALDDCFAATKFVSQHADSLNVDGRRIVVAGDSAGGHLAATVCLKAQQSPVEGLIGQLLIYPVVAPKFHTETYQNYADGYGLTRDTMMWFWQQYLAEQTPTSLANPLLADDFASVPPAHVITAEYDVLRSEGEHYADHLGNHGVPTTHMSYSGMLHGFVHFAGIFDVGREAITDIAHVIRGWGEESESADHV